MRIKYNHIEQYFVGPVVLNRYESHVKMGIFLKASEWDRQKHNPRREVEI